MILIGFLKYAHISLCYASEDQSWTPLGIHINVRNYHQRCVIHQKDVRRPSAVDRWYQLLPFTDLLVYRSKELSRIYVINLPIQEILIFSFLGIVLT